MRRLRVVFLGTPAFAVPALRALHGSGHEIPCVYTQPPRRSGRGMRETPSPVHEVAAHLGLPVRTPAGLRAPGEHEAFAALKADAALVAAYGLILPRPILAAPRLGCVNIHPSLLPRWRGAAPVERAILEGDAETGVTIMLMDEGLDTGPILLAERIAIGAETTAGELRERLAEIGGRLAVEAIEGLDAGRIAPRPQPDQGVTYAAKIAREEERLDWREDATKLARKVRAFQPRPGTWFEHEGERVRVLAAAREPAAPAAPGTVLDDRLLVACGRDALRVARVQRAGGKAMDAGDYLRGRPVPRGARLPCPD
jgi:methionyl-tRNA formyltransferase